MYHAYSIPPNLDYAFPMVETMGYNMTPCLTALNSSYKPSNTGKICYPQHIFLHFKVEAIQFVNFAVGIKYINCPGFQAGV
jgi:hypothetical protein